MEYRIRELKVSEIRLLRTFLYEAIYQPSNRDKLPVNIIDTPELYLYIKDWGKANDYCLVLVFRISKQPKITRNIQA